MSDDKCTRCHASLEGDGRTLKMDCFYDMSELDIPLEQFAIRGHFCKQIGVKNKVFLGKYKYEIPLFAEPDTTENAHEYRFFSIRVCKDCRAEWMKSIENWFKDVPKRESIGTGIFVRSLGKNVEITEEDFYRMRGIRK